MIKRMGLALAFLGAVTAAFGASAFFDKGETAFVNNRPQDARPLLETALADDPSNEKTYLYLGIVYQQLGDTQKAVDVLTRGLDVAGAYKDLFYYNIGNDLYSRKDYAGAAASYTSALAANSNLADAYLNRANARMQQQVLDGALADYTLFLQLRPQDPQRPAIEKMMGLIRQVQDDQQKAAAAAAEAAAAAQAAAAAKQAALMNDVLKSLSQAGDDTKNLTVESINGQNDPVNVDIKD